MLLVTNAKIFGFNSLQSILIENGIIKEIAESKYLRDKYNNVNIVDAKGKRVLPGLIDSHLHLISYSRLKNNIRLENAKSVKEIIILGKEYIKNNPTKKVIVGNLYNDNNLEEKRLLTKDDLDLISTELPIICYRVCGHMCSINSKAIELLNITPNTTVEGGYIDYEKGILKENALILVDNITKNFSIDEYKQFILDGIKDANSYGLTSLQVNDISGDYEVLTKVYTAYKELAKESKLNARIYHQFTPNNLEEFIKIYNYFDYENDYLKIGPLKLFIDGSLGANSAALYSNYINDDQNGIICLSKEELNGYIKKAKELNVSIIIHAIGDRGIDLVLENLKDYNEKRNAVVHVQITSKEILKKFKDYKVNAIVQPIFINTDMFMVYNKVKKELADTSYAFNTLIKNTITSFSSDAPIESMNPFYGIYHAVTRYDLSGNVSYNLHEKVSVIDAVKAYTEYGAYMSYEENYKGKIQVGYFGDLIIIDEDIYEIDPMKIKDISVLYTITGGKVVYEKFNS